MADLASTKVKNGYTKLLQVDTLSTETTVETGGGSNSALKLSQTKVEVNGDLKFTAAPDTHESTKLLVFNESNNLVRVRTLNSSVFDSIEVDSGWRDMHTNATAGTGQYYGVKTALSSDVQSRYVGREVKLKGTLYVPLDVEGASAGGSGTVATSMTENMTYDSAQLYTESGWSGANFKLTSPVIFSPDTAEAFSSGMVEQQLTPFVPMSRKVNLTEGTNPAMYTTFVSVFITADLKLEIRSRYAELGDASTHLISPVNEILMNFNTSHNYVDYANYLNTLAQDTKSNASHTPEYSFNGRGEVDMANWGGLSIRLDGLSFILPQGVALSTIGTAGV